MDSKKLDRFKKAFTTAFAQMDIYTREDMATYLGANKTYLSSILSGKDKLTDKFIEATAAKLGINIDYILTGEGSMFFKRDAKEDYMEVIKSQQATIDKQQATIDKQQATIDKQHDTIDFLIKKTVHQEEAAGCAVAK